MFACKIKNKTITTLVAASIMVSVVGCAQLQGVRNPFQGKPTAKLGALPEIQESDVAGKAEKLWHHKVAAASPRQSHLLPAVDGNVVFQVNNKGILFALNKTSGAKLWQVPLKQSISAGPAIIGDKLILGTYDAEVIALDKQTGKQLWIQEVTSEVLSTPAGNSRVVLANAIDGTLSALNLENGEIIWTYNRQIPILTLRGSSSPLLVKNYAMAGFANGKFVALNAYSGEEEWESLISAPRGRSELHRMVDVNTNPVVKDEYVYVASFQGHVSKINLQTGYTLWQRELSTYRNISVDDKAVYVTDENFNLWALDSETGATFWKQDALAERYITGPTVLGSFVLVGGQGGYLHWLNKNTGELKGRYSVGDKIWNDIVVSDNTVFVTTQNGNLSALRFLS